MKQSENLQNQHMFLFGIIWQYVRKRHMVCVDMHIQNVCLVEVIYIYINMFVCPVVTLNRISFLSASIQTTYHNQSACDLHLITNPYKPI
jgi:hypothetical protein